MWNDRSTEIAELPRPSALRRFVLDGGSAEGQWQSKTDRASIGANPANDLVLESRTVSRFHCEVVMREDGAWIRDLGSRNGTVVDGLLVKEARLREGSTLRLGDQELRFHYGDPSHVVEVSSHTRFGNLLGKSVSMRAAFHFLESAAPTDVNVLLQGETGTGKDAAAESIHAASPRADGPFVVVDCGAVAANLIESELFGHEKGAFTGAGARRVGAFEAASGGTVFLDEIGELPLDLQPKLLRVLEQRTIQRVGSSERIGVDVRIVCATNRDLRLAVNEGRFRSDLYYRIAVLTIHMPALRERPEDIPMIAESILGSLHADRAQLDALLSNASVEAMTLAAWPGNVRELRNYLEQCVVLQRPLPVASSVAPGTNDEPRFDPNVPYAVARQDAIAAFERGYTKALLEAHKGHSPSAAKAAGMDRAHLYRLLKKHGLLG